MKYTLWMALACLLVIIALYPLVRRVVENYRDYSPYTLSPAPLDHVMGHGVPYGMSGYKMRYDPTRFDYLYNRPGAKERRKLLVIQGTPTPLKHEESPSTLPKNSMFIFQKNLASPYCQSNYHTSTGQLCLSSDQTRTIGYDRGGNVGCSGKEYPFI